MFICIPQNKDSIIFASKYLRIAYYQGDTILRKIEMALFTILMPFNHWLNLIFTKGASTRRIRTIIYINPYLCLVWDAYIQQQRNPFWVFYISNR